MTLLDFLDYSGVAVFAATGALAASRKQLDPIGFVFLSAVTGIGGGTFRDIVLGASPVFWVQNPNYAIVCVAVAIAVYFTAHWFWSRYLVLIWLDAVGLAAYSVMGAAKGLAATGSPTVAVIMGTLTATFGGILRDLLAHEPSVLLRPEIYVTAALTGAASFTLLYEAGLSMAIASLLGIVAAFIVRGGAIKFGWTVPTYKARPGRDPKDVL